MSDRRLQWNLSEKQLVLQLRSSYSTSTISELRELFNNQTHRERHRTDEAVKSQLARLKEKGADDIENENTAAYSEAQLHRRQSLLLASKFNGNTDTMFANSNSLARSKHRGYRFAHKQLSFWGKHSGPV
jgi:hypothetical protein